MANYKSFGPLPLWVPDTSPGEPQSQVTPKAIHKIYFGAQAFSYDISLSWTSLRLSDSSTATATTSFSGGVTAIGSVSDEFDIIRPPGFTGFSAGEDIAGTWNFQLGSTTPFSGSASGFKIVIGTAGALDPLLVNPAHTSYTSDKECRVVGYVQMGTPNPFYDRYEEGAADEESPTGDPDPVLPILQWELGIAGAPFFGKVEESGDIVYDNYILSYVLSCTATPGPYWSWDGRINTVTGEP